MPLLKQLLDHWLFKIPSTNQTNKCSHKTRLISRTYRHDQASHKLTMSERRTYTFPTTSALPSSHRIPANDVSVQRTLGKISRPALINLVHEWLRPHNLPTCRPVLGEQDEQTDSVYDLHQTIDEVRQTYNDFRTRRGVKREVVDRIVEGDWRNGVSLRQLAMADVQYLMEHPNSQRWVALKLTRARAPLKEKQLNQKTDGTGKDQDAQKTTSPEKEVHLPRFEAPVFLHNLQSQIGSLLKAHYHLTHLPSLPLTLLRIAVLDSPYSSQTALQEISGDMWRTLFVAFPDNSPYVYVAVASALGGSNGPDGRSLRSLVVDAIPKAFSKPRERYSLETTAMSSKTLGALLIARGPGRTNAAGGGWSVFAKGTLEGTPLMVSTTAYETDEENQTLRKNQTIQANTSKTRKRPLSAHESTHLLTKKRRLLARDRFGASALASDDQGIDKFSIRIEDAYPITTPAQRTAQESFLSKQKPHLHSRNKSGGLDDPSFNNADDSDEEENETENNNKPWKPHVTITFHGMHVIAGVRALVECGAVDGQSMPGWMTGEDGVSLGVVREGRIVRSKGDGA